MNFPPEITANVPAIIDYGHTWIIGHLEGQLGDFAFKQLLRAIGRVFPSLAEVDPRELVKRMGRMESAFYGMQDELRILRELNPDWDIDSELLEPAAQGFASDTFAAIMESPNADKRDLLGRLIAKRLYSETETANELYLRQAESVTRRAGQSHLWAIATLYLVHYPPLPSGLTREGMYAWMDANLWPILQIVCKTDPSYDDLDYLTSLGVVLYDGSDKSSNLTLSEHAPAIEQRVLQATNEHFVPMSGQSVGLFYKKVHELYEGKFSRTQGQERISLAPYTLTLPGFTIGSTIVERFLREGQNA